MVQPGNCQADLPVADDNVSPLWIYNSVKFPTRVTRSGVSETAVAELVELAEEVFRKLCLGVSDLISNTHGSYTLRLALQVAAISYINKYTISVVTHTVITKSIFYKVISMIQRTQ